MAATQSDYQDYNMEYDDDQNAEREQSADEEATEAEVREDPFTRHDGTVTTEIGDLDDALDRLSDE